MASIVTHSGSTPDSNAAASDGLTVTVDSTHSSDGDNGADIDTTDVPASARRTSNRRPWVVAAGAVAVVAATIAVIDAVDGDEADTAPVDDSSPLRTAQATETDLVEFFELSGTLGYPMSTSVIAGTDGTITSITDNGDPIARGDEVYSIDAEPVTIVYGDIPSYRPLSEGDEGDDVMQLEAHLSALGHHAATSDDGSEAADADEIDAGFVVDGVFDEATTEAVLRWQEELGVEQTGVVRPDQLVIVPGPVVVSDVNVAIGARVQPGMSLAQLDGDSRVDTFHSEHAGELELVVDDGTQVETGDVLYTVDEQPVLAVVTADDVSFDRTLEFGVDDGDDVRALETMLVSLGFDVDGTLDIDEEFDAVTEAALLELWESLDGDYDPVQIDGPDDGSFNGSIAAEQLVVVEPGTRVGEPVTSEADIRASGAHLFSWNSGLESDVSEGSRLVTTAIDVTRSDQLSEGDTVDVELPDGTLVAGIVTSVALSSQIDPTNPTAEPTLAVEVIVNDVPDEVSRLNALDVDVLVVDQLVAGAVTVPVTALVAIGEGNYAVEVVESDGTRVFVEVEPGMFADGIVEVSGLSAGTTVVVP